jgi:Protein of unknown function (DUF2490)
MSSRRSRAGVWSVGCLLACLAGSSRAAAQSTGELWGDFTIDWLQSRRLTWQVDVEPKKSISVPSGTSGWTSLNVTPAVQYTLAKWVDALAEVDWGYKPNGGDVIETKTRVGLDFHILSRLLASRWARRGAELEKQPLRRLVPNNLLRLEYEDKDPLNGGATTTTWRLRDRQGISYPFNRRKLTADGAVYATGDVELFVLLGDASDPRFNQYRVRAGVGYRRDFSWRFEALFVQTRQRSGDSGFSTSSNAFDARVKRVF